MSLTNGSVIGGRYRLQRLIATGGMGQVWEATDSRLDRRVAVKVLKAEFSSDPEFLERFRIEARTTAQLNHPGIAGVYDYGETRDEAGANLAYLVMELVAGEPLNAVLARVGRLSIPHALDMLEQTGRALQVAHSAGVVHRDVKPGNILITPTGQVKITDFGIAKAVDASPVTRTGMVMGTAQYIAPEQALGQEATAASDVYSLGVVGYEALSGRRPFGGGGTLTVAMKHVQEPPEPMPAELPAPIRELIDITLTKDPAGRYSNGGEFADAVAAVRAGRRPPPPGRVPTGATSVVAPVPVAAPTAMMPTQQRNYTGDTGQIPDPEDGDGGWTSGQKAIAWAGGALLTLASLAALGMLFFDGGSKEPSTPPVVTSTSTSKAPATTTRTTPPTTTRTTTTTPPPVTTTTTTTPPPTTTTTTTPPPTTTTTTPPQTTTTTTAPTTTTTTTATTTTATQGQP
ncbi:serine/threonine-protein kinase [Rhodococcus sp. TAF43]|uniref:serine/threonine-protein kinase n=1 Tax=unclassified Rhodococcus (in: high G+C Gram-positive bacteria) TaxID=192944 RepID=UPI0015826FCE|nr:serine/threonine-protein kinase [Rhodococcus sp. W8901]QKT09358.1 serine/threonine protein kinase [Rhodococcus sp. W8901]